MEFPNWFEVTNAKPNFEKYLSRLKGMPDMQFLQLGAYTGDASVWLLENVLTDNSSHLTDVDTWAGSDEEAHKVIDFDEVEKYYDSRTKQYNNLTKFKGLTVEWLKGAPFDYYDFIYVDADHTAVGTLIDAELSWMVLKPGGILAFDDYEWTSGKGLDYEPKPGINIFLARHAKELDIILHDTQVWVFKK